MMKKILFLAVAAISLIFSGCIKDDDTAKKLKPVQKGIEIYSYNLNQFMVASEQANIGMRLAMLVAEADKQGVENLEEVKVDNRLIKQQTLGGSAKVEKSGDIYKITFYPGYAEIDNYVREGVVLIDTKGVPVIEDTTPEVPWMVSYESTYKMNYSGSNLQHFVISGGTTALYNNGTGSYAVSIAGHESYYSSSSSIKSSWGGSLTVKPEKMNFTYSDCNGKKFIVNGSVSGPTFYALDGANSTEMRFRVKDGQYYTPSYILGGIIYGELLNFYNPAVYPSNDVSVEWTVNAEGTRLLQTITYNGNVVTV